MRRDRADDPQNTTPPVGTSRLGGAGSRGDTYSTPERSDYDDDRERAAGDGHSVRHDTYGAMNGSPDDGEPARAVPAPSHSATRQPTP